MISCFAEQIIILKIFSWFPEGFGVIMKVFEFYGFYEFMWIDYHFCPSLQSG